MATFLAYTTPAAGHLFPTVPGLLALRARGHAVHVLAQDEYLGELRALALQAHALDPAIEAIEVRDHDAATPAERLAKGLTFLMERGELQRAELERAIAELKPDALLVDSIAYGGLVAAEASGLPWASLIPSLLPLPGKGIPPYGLGLKPNGSPFGRIRDAVLTKAVIRMYGKAMLPRLNELRTGAGLAPFTNPVQSVLAPDRVIVMTGDPLEYERTDLPAQVRFVGAQLWDPPAEAPAWLDEPGDPWVLVTCSTDYQGDERLAATAIEALRDEPVRVLVTLADAHEKSELPHADNVRVERFVAHGPVLERAAAVVCHGGMGIVQKAMAAAVPIAAVPFGRDQPEVARRISEAGAGVAVPLKRLSAERLRGAVREAMAMRPAVESAARRLRAFGGADSFAEAAEELAAGSDLVLEAHGGALLRG
jgi:MGT family glycosyltransferase